MPEPRTRKKARRPVRFVKTTPPGRRSAKRPNPPRGSSPRPSTVQKRAAARAAAVTELPGWHELSGSDSGSARKNQLGGLFATVSTLRAALVIIAVAAVVLLYVGHVYATSSLLAEVDALRRQNLELHLERNQAKAAFDRASSPARIAARARALGLVETVPAGTPLQISGRQ